MKDLVKSVLQNWHWILIFSMMIGFTIFLHHMFLSGVNPIISNVLVLIITIFFIVSPIAIFSRKKIWNIKSITNLIFSTFLTIALGLLIGRMILSILNFM